MWCFRTGVAPGCMPSWAAGGVRLLGCFLAATATDRSLLLPTEQCRPACSFFLLFFKCYFLFFEGSKALGIPVLECCSSCLSKDSWPPLTLQWWSKRRGFGSVQCHVSLFEFVVLLLVEVCGSGCGGHS